MNLNLCLSIMGIVLAIMSGLIGSTFVAPANYLQYVAIPLWLMFAILHFKIYLKGK